MSEYIPTEEALKQAYVNGISANPCDDQSECDVCAEAHAHVDRFLARAKAEAWDEGYWQGGERCWQRAERKRADTKPVPERTGR